MEEGPARSSDAAGEPRAAGEASAALARPIDAAAHTGVAELFARSQAFTRQEEAKAIAKKARIIAELEREEQDEKSVFAALRAGLARERNLASEGSFGMTIALVLVLAGLIAGGMWYFSSQNQGSISAANGVSPGSIASIAVSDFGAFPGPVLRVGSSATALELTCGPC